MAIKQAIRAGSMFLGLCLSTTILAASDDQADLARLLEAFLDGASVNDAAVHDRFWAEDLIYTSSDGQRFGKAEIMDSLAETEGDGADATTPPPDYSARDVRIQLHGDTAVVTFRLIARQDGEVVGEYYNTGVFRRRDTGWRAVTWQATRAAQQVGE
ncbi:nuclear transport factor 2 family protein [Wenzhouxiangella sp. EGI_FJ10305]|uniref:nuclear transport factor 2 family protein n=1 Tax=Wenzhouxiangella sp. EGI_FJ10305 TaxID=3243768 RepID=UPI0035E0D74B